MVGLLIIGIFQAALLVVLLLSKRNKEKSDYILASYLFFSALIILFAYLEIWNRNNDFPHPWLINISTPLILLIGPLLWLYVKSLTEQHFRIKPIYSLTLIPFVAVLLMLLLRNYLEPEAAKISAELTEEFKTDFVFRFILGLIAASNLGYTIWGLFLIRSYRKALKTYFSTTESINLSWLRFLLISALVCYACISGLYILDNALSFITYHAMQLIGFSIASLLVLIIGFFGLKQGNIFTETALGFDVEKALKLPEPNTSINNEEETFVHKLLAYMKEVKPHMNSEITLPKLSGELKVSPEFMSKIINGRLNMNFFDFINHHRIEEFKARCKDSNSHNYTLIGLAYDCGFNSKATFNRVFKKATGVTPSQYMARINKA